MASSPDPAPPGTSREVTRHIGRWREVLREHFVALDVAPDRDGRFGGAVSSTPVGHLSVSTVDSTSQDVVRTAGLSASAREQYLQVGLVARGRAVVHQDGREALLGPGAFTIYETERPFSWRLDGPWRLLVFTWPRALARLDPDVSRAATARALGGDRLAAIVARMLTDLASAPPPLTDVGGTQLADELAELVGTVAGEVLRRGDVLSPRHAADLRRRVGDYVAEHLEDPELGPESIARAHFVSPRQLHHAFADASTTVSALVRHRRLEHARRELLDPHLAHVSITEIGARAGFRGLATFSSAFKQTYREPPSTARRRGGG